VSKAYDAVIIGAGHNGLVCGAYLARAGHKVCVLERRHLIGGAAVTEELWPGFKVSTAAYTMALLQPRIILELELKKHGFEVIAPTPMFQPLEGGEHLTFYNDMERTRAGIARFFAQGRRRLSALSSAHARRGGRSAPPALGDPAGTRIAPPCGGLAPAAIRLALSRHR
jgi:phytoene dehydrogenase-like protein